MKKVFYERKIVFPKEISKKVKIFYLKELVALSQRIASSKIHQSLLSKLKKKKIPIQDFIQQQVLSRQTEKYFLSDRACDKLKQIQVNFLIVMNILKDLLSKDSKSSIPRPLFSQLKTLKQQLAHVRTKSPQKLKNSIGDKQEDALEQISQKLQLFKKEKALEIARRHIRQKKSIDEIATEMKSLIQYEALCIIDGKMNKKQRNSDDKDISTEGESTIRKSVERSFKQTPNFDNTQQKGIGKNESAISEFTLGNRQRGYLSNKSSENNQAKLQNVSQFTISFPQKISKSIKNRIMNTNMHK